VDKECWYYLSSGHTTYCLNLRVSQGISNMVRLEYLRKNDRQRIIKLIPPEQNITFHLGDSND